MNFLTQQKVRPQAYNGNEHSWLLFQLGLLHECTVPQFTDQEHCQNYHGSLKWCHLRPYDFKQCFIIIIKLSTSDHFLTVKKKPKKKTCLRFTGKSSGGRVLADKVSSPLAGEKLWELVSWIEVIRITWILFLSRSKMLSLRMHISFRIQWRFIVHKL